MITLGGRGALVSLDDQRTTVPAVPTSVVATVGAGDSFTAGLLDHLQRRGRLGGRLENLTLTLADAAAARQPPTPSASPH